jgi:opacity protein-like surface antigen
MFKNVLIAAVLVIALMAGGDFALALDPIPKQSGFSGYIQPGAGYMSIKSNTVAKVLNFDLSDQRIGDLDDEPDSESTAIFTVPYKLAYTFAGSRTELFLGTEVGDLLSFDTAQQLGVKQEIGSFGVLQAGVLFSGIVRVWKDPLSYEDLDGEAMANNGVDLQLTYLYDGDPVTLVLNGYVGQADYDKSNPVFDKTREDDRYGAMATVYYKNPWGWTLFGSEPMRFFVTGAYYAIDSNIDFYNQEAILGMGGIAFRWK